MIVDKDKIIASARADAETFMTAVLPTTAVVNGMIDADLVDAIDMRIRMDTGGPVIRARELGLRGKQIKVFIRARHQRMHELLRETFSITKVGA
jgi:hypothetical protein